MDLQPRAPEHGAWRHHTDAETGDGRLTPLLASAKSGGITRGGDGVEKNETLARDLFRSAFTKSRSDAAAYWLGMMYLKGKGGATDYAAAKECFDQANNSAICEIELGLMAIRGLGAPKNEALALVHFDRAWALGHPLGLKYAALIRWRQKRYVRASIEFVRSAALIFWYYGVQRLSVLRAPNKKRSWSK